MAAIVVSKRYRRLLTTTKMELGRFIRGEPALDGVGRVASILLDHGVVDPEDQQARMLHSLPRTPNISKREKM